MALQGATVVLDAAYLYDTRGDLTHIDDLADPAQNRDMTYDSARRLATASGPWGSGAITYRGVHDLATVVHRLPPDPQ